MTTYHVDPQATLDYSVDFASWLASGETISSVTWIVPAGLTEVARTNDASSATIWLVGEGSGQRTPVTCRITTSAGRQDDRSFTIRLRST